LIFSAKLSVLCVSAVNVGANTLTAEAQRRPSLNTKTHSRNVSRSRSNSCCFVLVLCYFVDRMLCLAGKRPTKTTRNAYEVTQNRSLLVSPLPVSRDIFELTFHSLLNNYLPLSKGAYQTNDLCSCCIMC